MKADLLRIYARSNLSSFYIYVIVVVLFTGVRIQLYGLPISPGLLLLEVGRHGLIFLVCFLALMKTRDQYRKILSEKLPLRERGCNKITAGIALCKFIYMTCWLYFLFAPLNSPRLYDQDVGYAFVFFALGIYASVSAAYLPLFLWDMGLQVGFASYVLWLHRGMEATPYLAGVLLLFAFYSFVSGLRITKTTKQLVESGYALKKAAVSATQANKSKSDFLAVMSHEIRTPMTGILGMVDFLTETKLDQEQKSCVTAITECSRTLLNTLNDILDFSRIEAGKLSISNINLDLYSVLENAVKVLKTTATEKNIDLRLTISDDSVPRYIYGDPHRIRQALMNLINNAIKFTEAGYVEVAVSFRTGVIRIEVRDTGIGIDPTRAQHLFRPFSQADNSISRKYGGSGLGLSIAKHLVEAMGGKIGLGSRAGGGSIFWIHLPYREPVPASPQNAENRKDSSTAAQNILLVEDNHINQMICSRLLTQRGHHITVANDGDSALELMRTGTYDLVLMDCSLPGRSGLDVTRAIRAMGGRNRELPIIALTANGMEDHLKQCLEAGMNDCIVKPYEPERLYSVISSYTAGAPVLAATNSKLKAIQEEMGPEYMEHLVRSSQKEIARLMQQIMASSEKHDYGGLQQASHDLKAVAGSIGLEKTQALAEALEKACIQKDHAALPEITQKLVVAIEARKE